MIGSGENDGTTFDAVLGLSCRRPKIFEIFLYTSIPGVRQTDVSDLSPADHQFATTTAWAACD